MKTLLYLILVLLTPMDLIAQSNYILTSDSDTAFWYKIKNYYANQFDLNSIEIDTSDFSFRFWSNGLTIKVIRQNNNFLGIATRFVEAYPLKRKRKIFKKIYKIQTDSVIKIFNLIDTFKIQDLPSDKNIKGWQQGLDGVTYFIDYKQNNNYTFKNYWTPTSQDSLKEAQQLEKFITSITNILKSMPDYKNFESKIPFNSWTYPGSSTSVLRIIQRD